MFKCLRSYSRGFGGGVIGISGMGFVYLWSEMIILVNHKDHRSIRYIGLCPIPVKVI